MADKVNKEESVARVYQFLNKQKDWKNSADKNGDGTVIKTEFRAYLLGSGFKFNNGENKEDLIDAFWKSVDSQTSGKIGKGSALSDKNALNANEVNNIEKSIEATQIIIKFMQDKEAPSELDAQYRTAWKNSVKQGLIYKASEFLKNADLEALTEEWLNGAYKLSSAKATADYTATAVIKFELGTIEGYKVADDMDLKSVIDEYVTQLEENPKEESAIISDIKQIVAAYVDTAKTNSAESINLLAQYGYDPDDNLNDLQVAVLTNEITSKILEYLKSNNSELYTDDYKEQVEAAVKEYVQEYLSDKSASEFSSLKSFDVSLFTNSTEYAELKALIESQIKEVKDARSELKSYILSILAENDDRKTQIIKDIIGATDTEGINKKLDELKTVAEVAAKKSEIQTKLAELDAQIAAEKAAEEAKYKARFTNLAGLIENIQTEYISQMTNGKATIHTEFGIDASGNIVFEQIETSEVYEKMKTTLKEALKQKDKDSYEAIGESNIDKLVQSAWIMTYNTFDSSKSNSTAAFITAVLNNFESILNKLKDNPEYLSVYTGHTAYSNSKLTSNLLYYGKANATDGNDDLWEYEGSCAISSDGSVDWEDKNDAAEYKAEMDLLLKNILKTEPYANIDSNLITNVFREAQQKALKTCQGNTQDCPYGTTSGVDVDYERGGYFGWGSRNYNSEQHDAYPTPNVDWQGTSREGDSSNITVRALVELTLYYFDKLLYAKLAA